MGWLFKSEPNIEKWGKIATRIRAGENLELSKADKEIIPAWNAYLKCAFDLGNIIFPNDTKLKYYMASFEWNMKNIPRFKRQLRKSLAYYAILRVGEEIPNQKANEIIQIYRSVNSFAQLMSGIMDNV